MMRNDACFLNISIAKYTLNYRTMRGDEYIIAHTVKIECNDGELTHSRAVMVVVISADLQDIHFAFIEDHIEIYDPELPCTTIATPEAVAIEYAEDPAISPQLHWREFYVSLARFDDDDEIIRRVMYRALSEYVRVVEVLAQDREYVGISPRAHSVARAARMIMECWDTRE